jgi:uncharacterized protein HemX
MDEMSHETLAVIIGLLGLLLGGGGVVAFFKLRPENRKANAEADKTQAEAWAILVENLSKRVASLELSVAEKDRRILELERSGQEKDQQIERLETQVSEQEAKIEAQAAEIAVLREMLGERVE